MFLIYQTYLFLLALSIFLGVLKSVFKVQKVALEDLKSIIFVLHENLAENKKKAAEFGLLRSKGCNFLVNTVN